MDKTKILIVDDEEAGRKLIKTILSQASYDTYEAPNGEEALRILYQEIPDLIILDIRMPKMDGYQLCYEIRSNISFKNIPVIMLTVMGDTLDKIRGHHLGIDDYITKPFEPEEFLARVGSVLKRRKVYEEISMTDGVTGLYNIHFFKKQLEIFFNMARRNNQEFSLAIIDVNKFKKINDKFGHVVGDYVLKKISAIMKDVLRKTDIITRYGGDEFAIILPKLSNEQAITAMKKLKKKIKNGEFISEKTGKKFNVSISTGVATWENTIINETQLFELADADMYKDKKVV